MSCLKSLLLIPELAFEKEYSSSEASLMNGGMENIARQALTNLGVTLSESQFSIFFYTSPLKQCINVRPGRRTRDRNILMAYFAS